MTTWTWTGSRPATGTGSCDWIIPVAEKAKPRKITINRDEGTDQAITTGHNGNGKQRNDNTVDAAVNA